jgi:hypothetical protein
MKTTIPESTRKIAVLATMTMTTSAESGGICKRM